MDRDDSVSDWLREHVLYLCSDSVINLSWCWKRGSEQDLVYLSVPDGYGCQQTPGQCRASPRQRGGPPAKANLTFPTVSSWDRDRGDEGQRGSKGERGGGRVHERRLVQPSTPSEKNIGGRTAEQTKILFFEQAKTMWEVSQQRSEKNENRVDVRKTFFPHRHILWI